MTPETDKLVSLLARQERNAILLMTALKDEQAALTANKITAIEAAIQAKFTCLQQLEEDAQSQTVLLQQAGLRTDEAGMITYLHRCDPAGELMLEAMWNKAKEALARCREQNLINGRLVLIHQRQTQQALAILRGSSEQGEDCYSAKGRGAKGMPSRSLGRV